MRRTLVPAVLGLMLLFSCSLVPNATVRVAVPPADPEAEAAWKALSTALRTAEPGLSLETVVPGAFPPPDLVWFDGDPAGQAYLDHALGANAQIETLARDSGLAPAWFGPWSGRVLPLAWAPWAWWTPVPDGVPGAVEADRRALAAVEALLAGPSLGQGTPVPPATEEHGRVWRPWSAWAGGTPPTDLAPGPSPVVPARVLGLWWNQEGWNRDRVSGLLARLWSRPVQEAWKLPAGFLPVNTAVPVPGPARKLQDLGLAAETILPRP